MQQQHVATFTAAAEAVGADVRRVADVQEAAAVIAALASGPVLLPSFPSGERLGLAEALQKAGCAAVTEAFRQRAATAAVGVSGANFALAATGTLVLESTPEPVRLATTLPELHVALLDPRKIIADDLAAVPVLRSFHQRQPRNFLAYVTGPSRTADIERVLTIGVHGPKRLVILLLDGLSDNPLEM